MSYRKKARADDTEVLLKNKTNIIKANSAFTDRRRKNH